VETTKPDYGRCCHTLRIGLKIPHFSSHCTWEGVIGLAPEIERLGFDSVWVRDHLSYEPGAYDPPGRAFVDPFVTLGAVAGATKTIKLGFCVIVPFRHPLVTAQLVGSLAWVSRGRVELGMGIGGPAKQFEVTGIPYRRRASLCQDTIEVLRLAASGKDFSYTGGHTSFESAHVDPGPPPTAPIWYGGYSLSALERAAACCDGIMPGKCKFTDFDPAVETLRRITRDRPRTMLIGTEPFIVLGKSRKAAIDSVSDQIARMLTSRTSDDGAYSDLNGAIIAGTPDECSEQLHDYATRGVDCVVLDPRLQAADFPRIVATIGEDILPRFLPDGD